MCRYKRSDYERKEVKNKERKYDNFDNLMSCLIFTSGACFTDWTLKMFFQIEKNISVLVKCHFHHFDVVCTVHHLTVRI